MNILVFMIYAFALTYGVRDNGGGVEALQRAYIMDKF